MNIDTAIIINSYVYGLISKVVIVTGCSKKSDYIKPDARNRG